MYLKWIMGDSRPLNILPGEKRLNQRWYKPGSPNDVFHTLNLNRNNLLELAAISTQMLTEPKYAMWNARAYLLDRPPWRKLEGPPRDLGRPQSDLGGPQRDLGGPQWDLGGPQREF